MLIFRQHHCFLFDWLPVLFFFSIWHTYFLLSLSLSIIHMENKEYSISKMFENENSDCFPCGAWPPLFLSQSFRFGHIQIQRWQKPVTACLILPDFPPFVFRICLGTQKDKYKYKTMIKGFRFRGDASYSLFNPIQLAPWDL